MVKLLTRLFDRIEDKVRGRLSHYPIVYAFISGFGIVMFWRGIWDTADMFPFLTGPVSLLISLVILLLSGVFVSFFVGDTIIIAGIKREKKLAEKTEIEIETEKEELDQVRSTVNQIKADIEEIKRAVVRKQ